MQPPWRCPRCEQGGGHGWGRAELGHWSCAHLPGDFCHLLCALASLPCLPSKQGANGSCHKLQRGPEIRALTPARCTLVCPNTPTARTEPAPLPPYSIDRRPLRSYTMSRLLHQKPWCGTILQHQSSGQVPVHPRAPGTGMSAHFHGIPRVLNLYRVGLFACCMHGEHDLQSECAAEAQSVCFSRHQWETHLPPRSQQHGQQCSRAGGAMVVWTHLSPTLGLGNKLGPHLHHPTQLGDGGGHGSLPQHGVRAASSHTKQLCSRCGRHLVTSCSP